MTRRYSACFYREIEENIIKYKQSLLEEEKIKIEQRRLGAVIEDRVATWLNNEDLDDCESAAWSKLFEGKSFDKGKTQFMRAVVKWARFKAQKQGRHVPHYDGDDLFLHENKDKAHEDFEKLPEPKQNSYDRRVATATERVVGLIEDETVDEIGDVSLANHDLYRDVDPCDESEWRKSLKSKKHKHGEE